MIRLVTEGAAGQPAEWMLCFRRHSESRIANILARGCTFKHVMAFGYIREVDHWVFFDWRMRAIDITVARGKGAEFLMAHYMNGADVLSMKPLPEAGRPMLRFGCWCVPAVKHLIGLRSSALRPDALWRDCIAAGAEIVSHGYPAGTAISAGPDAVAGVEAGRAGQDPCAAGAGGR